ncbi:hypothetical protein HPB47_001123, partial [Ixodes persulcatus]
CMIREQDAAMVTFRTKLFRGLVWSVVWVLAVVFPFFLLPSLMSGPAPPPPIQSTNPFLKFPNDTPIPINSVGGWAAREACRYPLDVLFFVHSAPNHWKHRAVYRDTLASPMATGFFNWTAVYFVGESKDDDVSKAWNQLEADWTGDLVILPFLDSYRNLSLKFVGGMQWVIQNCPRARYIVKLDDDLFVEPKLLQWYMLSNVTATSRDLHCFIWDNMHTYRDPGSPWYVPMELFPAAHYYTYCSGRSIIMTMAVMRDLYRWSSLVPSYSVDDAYVTGDLALAAGVGHINMQAHITWADEEAYGVLRGRYVFAHVSCGYGFIMRRALWHLAVVAGGLVGWQPEKGYNQLGDVSARLTTMGFTKSSPPRTIPELELKLAYYSACHATIRSVDSGMAR